MVQRPTATSNVGFLLAFLPSKSILAWETGRSLVFAAEVPHSHMQTSWTDRWPPAQDVIITAYSLKAAFCFVSWLSSREEWKFKFYRDTWVAQSVQPPTLDFSSGHDLWVMESSPPGACLRFSLILWKCYYKLEGKASTEDFIIISSLWKMISWIDLL